MLRPLAPLFAVLPLLACAPEPEPANPALWQVSCSQNQRAYLFGTVHALERPTQWRGKTVDAAFADANLLMVEIIPHKDRKAQAEPFSRLSQSPGHGPLSTRLPADLRPPLLDLLNKNGFSDEQFDGIETWAAALTIAQASTKRMNSAYGIDKAVLDAAGEKRVEQLEGLEPQLRIFDALPESEQRDLLAAVVRDASTHPDDAADLAKAWRTGDMKTITKETERGMLAIAVVGLVANGIAMLRLRRGQSISERVVALHFVEDVLGWTAVLIGSVVMMYADVPILDPILSIGIALFILYNAYKNLRQSFRIILQGIPENVDVESVREKILDVPGVTGMHDLHTWSMDGQYNIMTVHVTVREEDFGKSNAIKKEIRKRLSKMNIQHLTIETEVEGDPCAFLEC